jgi:hypothetical protein
VRTPCELAVVIAFRLSAVGCAGRHAPATQPARGAKPPHYVFTLYALPRPSGLRASASAGAVRAALAAPLARGRLVGTCSRAS